MFNTGLYKHFALSTHEILETNDPETRHLRRKNREDTMKEKVVVHRIRTEVSDSYTACATCRVDRRSLQQAWWLYAS
jgi:hypothetical protein